MTELTMTEEPDDAALAGIAVREGLSWSWSLDLDALVAASALGHGHGAFQPSEISG